MLVALSAAGWVDILLTAFHVPSSRSSLIRTPSSAEYLRVNAWKTIGPFPLYDRTATRKKVGASLYSTAVGKGIQQN